MKIEYRHGLTTEEAYKKIDGLLDALQQRFQDQVRNPEKSWNASHDRMEFSLEVRRQLISGSLVLTDDMAILEIGLPILARAYSDRIEDLMREELDQLFGSGG
ncbi:MAG: polyhydroxyalkanoic acid system family protein [Dehalococcoidia bacterium]